MIVPFQTASFVDQSIKWGHSDGFITKNKLIPRLASSLLQVAYDIALQL